ncbi:MAG: hypothetical protein OHK0022_13850 [Roseiflexaceae bacterium]
MAAGSAPAGGRLLPVWGVARISTGKAALTALLGAGAAPGVAGCAVWASAVVRINTGKGALAPVCWTVLTAADPAPIAAGLSPASGVAARISSGKGALVLPRCAGRPPGALADGAATCGRAVRIKTGAEALAIAG